tara:strand:+ start:3384 stop:3881 length:498 start_codon:yes stop_codon:yes gene_type:complete
MVQTDKLIKCNRCDGDACYEQKVNSIKLYSCYGCGFQTSTMMKKGEKFFEEQMEILPELYKALLGEDDDGMVWMPQTVNLPQQGMVFASTARDHGIKGEVVSQNNYEWAAVKAIPIDEKDKEKYPIPNKKGEFYEWRMDMTTEKRFSHKDFVEALDYIEVFKKEN